MDLNLKSNGNMAVNKVDITVSQLINDLNTGLTWYKKDDLGYGSIEAKYGATAPQIMAIRKHPALKDAETTITIFNIIDDTKDGTNTEPKRPQPARPETISHGSMVSVDSPHSEMETAADVFSQL